MVGQVLYLPILWPTAKNEVKHQVLTASGRKYMELILLDGIKSTLHYPSFCSILSLYSSPPRCSTGCQKKNKNIMKNTPYGLKSILNDS